MARKGREFELAYKHLYDMLDKNIYKITSPAFPIDKTTGKPREVDVLIEYKDSESKPRRISIECRDRSTTQDVTWIEQLVQKKEDLDLDYTIATTTTNFSDGAIAKANYHGIIIEQAEMPSAEKIETLQKTTFMDFFFYKFDLLECSFFVNPHGFMPLKEFIKTLNVMDKSALLKEINTKFLWSFEPTDIIKEHTHSNSLDFFSTTDNSLTFNGTKFLPNEKPYCLRNAVSIKFKIKVVPRKISLPITNSFSVFDGENKTNKKYRADFTDKEEYFSIAYLDNNLVVDCGLKPRRFWRIAGSTMHLNTIIPEDANFDTDTFMQHITENHMGEFDLTHIL